MKPIEHVQKGDRIIVRSRHKLVVNVSTVNDRQERVIFDLAEIVRVGGVYAN